jgi:HlyD family secretion protein
VTKRGKRTVWAVAAVILLGVVASYFVGTARRNRTAVQTGPVKRRSLASVVSASGEIKPKKYVNIGANVSGRITALYVQEGDPVKAGQLLGRIDATRFEAENDQSKAAVASAEAEVNRARADVEVAKLDFERTESMHRDRLVSDQMLDQSRAQLQMKVANLESVRSRVAQLRAAMASTRDTLDKAVIVAPMSGTVTSLQKEVGEVVIGAQSFQPTVIMVVGDLSIMEAEVLVDETDIDTLKLHQLAEVRVDAFEKDILKGEVTEIGSGAIPRGGTQQSAPGASTSTQAKDFKVTITLQDPPPGLRPGLNATADITTATRDAVLAVPLQAVVVRALDETGRPVDPGLVSSAEAGPKTTKGTGRPRGEEKEGVFVVSNGQAVFKPVKTGIVGETEIEITDGLAEGEEIVTGSYKTLRTLKHDAKIRVENRKPGEARS